MEIEQTEEIINSAITQIDLCLKKIFFLYENKGFFLKASYLNFNYNSFYKEKKN